MSWVREMRSLRGLYQWDLHRSWRSGRSQGRCHPAGGGQALAVFHLLDLKIVVQSGHMAKETEPPPPDDRGDGYRAAWSWLCSSWQSLQRSLYLPTTYLCLCWSTRSLCFLLRGCVWIEKTQIMARGSTTLDVLNVRSFIGNNMKGNHLKLHIKASRCALAMRLVQKHYFYLMMYLLRSNYLNWLFYVLMNLWPLQNSKRLNSRKNGQAQLA